MHECGYMQKPSRQNTDEVPFTQYVTMFVKMSSTLGT